MKSNPRIIGFQVRCERVRRPSVKEGGLFYFYVRLYLESIASTPDCLTLDDVDYVIYRLHPSFGEHRLQRSGSRSTNYEIKIWTYGWFVAAATVITKDGETIELKGNVEFEATDEEKKNNGREEFRR